MTSSDGRLVRWSISSARAVMLVSVVASLFCLESSSGALAGGISNCTREGWVPPKISVEGLGEKSGRSMGCWSSSSSVGRVPVNGGSRLCRFPRMEENRPVPDRFHDAGVVMFLKMFVMDSTVSSSSWMIVEARTGRGDVMVKVLLVGYGRFGDRLKEYCGSKQQYLVL